MLGDVCGKGEEAAAITATVREGVRLLGLWNDDQAAVLRQVNHAMIARKETDRFVTAVVACVRMVAGGAVRLTSAGHPPAAVLRADATVLKAVEDDIHSYGGRARDDVALLAVRVTDPAPSTSP